MEGKSPTFVDAETFTNFLTNVLFDSKIREEKQKVLYQMRVIIRTKLLELVCQFRLKKNYEPFNPKNCWEQRIGILVNILYE